MQTYNGVGTVQLGAYAAARLGAPIPTDTPLVGVYANWNIRDADMRVWASGSVHDLTVRRSQVENISILEAELSILVPNNLPVNQNGTQYQLCWHINTVPAITTFETFTVLPAVEESAGAQDTICLDGDPLTLALRLDKAQNYAKCTVYKGNSKLTSTESLTHKIDGTEHVYTMQVTKQQYAIASLEPLLVVWEYGDSQEESVKETSQAYVVNPLMLDAIKDMQTWLNAAYNDYGNQPSTTLWYSDYIKYLRLGCDHFNAAVKPTSFTMTAANGPIRWFWIGYSNIAAARSQYLVEGMKTFNYSSQDITLEHDRSQYWDQVATQIESQLSEQIKPFKDNLYKRGLLGGSGNSLGLQHGASGAVGITIHGASPVRNFMYGLGGPFTPYLR